MTENLTERQWLKVKSGTMIDYGLINSLIMNCILYEFLPLQNKLSQTFLFEFR